ncbi:phosphoglycolate phosphatase [Nisaea acidiphila]|uniref:Phosphoglycolate phosphatase n=1 Tax=Nisaea acidiphila TaxID=1862145 RepID=A0A9J7ASZ8_9PROT|nr:phosphoglycolate phosphatase [Nisaea acidiphila]UUX49617.1 phosphoglycolate phosphatase [Nisaea acidiphila]
MPRALSAIVFDLDGTLIDSVPDLHAAGNMLLAERGLEPIDLPTARRFVGDGGRVFVRRALAERGVTLDDEDLTAATERFIALYEAHASDRTLPYPDVPETLEKLKAAGYRLGICTNKPERATHKVLALLGLDHLFEAIVGGDTLPVRKPDPEHAAEVLRRLGVAPEAACMVGDNEHDSSAGRGAGMRFILMRYGYARTPLEEIPADARLDRFRDLPDTLASLA